MTAAGRPTGTDRRRFATAVVLAVIFSWASSLPGASGAPTASELPSAARRLEGALGKGPGIRMDFDLVREVDLTGETLGGSGFLAFRRPDRFRLVYLDPEPQEMVVAGDSLWVLLFDQHQAMRFTFDPEAPGSEVFLLFRGRMDDLTRLFEITEEPWAGYDDALLLVPSTEDPTYPLEELRLAVDRRGVPVRLAYREITGDTVTFEFRRRKATGAELDRLTRLRLPAGMEVLDGDELTGDRSR